MHNNDNHKEILSPFTLPNGTQLKNRVMMAPMTTCTGYYDGSITDELVDYYRDRAGTIGTVIVECGFIDELGLAFPGAIGLDSDNKIEGLAKIAKAIQSKGSKAVIQVYHGGRMVDPKLIGGQTTVGPSAIAAPREGAATPRELSADEVDGMIAKFGDAVRRAIKAGFDGVEIHGANTYLIQQFFSPNSNQRTDKWGGSRENRARFPLAILEVTQKMVRQYADPSFIIGYRFSPEEMEVPGIRFDDTMYLMEQLAEQGLHYVHWSMGYTLRPSIVDRNDPTPLIQKYVALRSEKLAQIPVVGVGGIVNKADADIAIENGYDLVAVGKACIAFPDWTDRIARGETLELFIDSTQRKALSIPEPLWRFSLVDAMIRDLSSMPTGKFKSGVFQEKVQDDTRELVVNVSLETDHIADIALDIRDDLDVEFMTSFEEIRTRILDANTPHVDAVSGATSQSEAVKKAVTKAMSKSCKQMALEEGGSLEPASYDVVVIGSGGAGLAAAIQASDHDAKVLIVEKMSTIGGNTIKASVGMNAAETRFQKLKGIVDSKEKFYQESLKGGHGKNNPELLRSFVNNAPEAVEWLADRGIELNDITITGGMSIDRTHRPADRSAVGGFLISGLLRNVNQRENIDVMLDTDVIELLTDNGAVSGLRVKNEEGEVLTIHAKSIVMASGGFSANQAMVVKYRPDLKGFVTTNHKGATGSGIALLENIGAGTVDMGEIQIHPTVEQTTSYLISEAIRGGGAILVNQKGERFFNEMETRDKVSAAIIGLPEHFAYVVFDDQVRQNNKAADEYISRGFVICADSPRELADKVGMDMHKLLATLERYNGFVEKQDDEDFGRKTALRHPIHEGPFYAIRIAPGVHHTMGGVTVNTNTEVLDVNKQVIPGAFAAGEVVGGIHGGNRIGGNAVADIIIFGTMAGRNAAYWARR